MSKNWKEVKVGEQWGTTIAYNDERLTNVNF